MGAAYQRGLILFRQKRWKMAIEQFQLEAQANPTSAGAFAMLALSLVNDKQIHGAYSAASEALRINPQSAQAHYAMSHVALRRDRDWSQRRNWFRYESGSARQQEQRRRLKAAKASLLEAIRLYPFEPAYFDFLSAIESDLRRWKASLAAAERGLEIDPRHLGCANRRAMLLNHLGRTGEARAEIDRAIGIDPEDALTHRNRGWVLLQAGAAREARQHFLEALRLNPMDRRARSGLRQAKLAWFPPYRWLLRLLLWSRIGAHRRALILAIIGADVLSQVNTHQLHLPPVPAIGLGIAAGVGMLVGTVFALALWRRVRRRTRTAQIISPQPTEAP